MKLRKKRKADTSVEEFDITSLLDILVILLVFLLKSFTDSELTVDLANELALPYALQRGVTKEGVIVQVNQKKIIYYNKKPIGSAESEATLGNLGRMLKKKYSEINSLDEKNKKIENKLINLVFDQSLEYRYINQILDVSANSGFGKYKLIVQGDE